MYILVCVYIVLLKREMSSGRLNGRLNEEPRGRP